MDTEELIGLIAAAHVRGRASELRIAASRQAHPSDSAAQTAWARQHGIEEFVPAAMKDLKAVLTVMASLPAEAHPHPSALSPD